MPAATTRLPAVRTSAMVGLVLAFVLGPIVVGDDAAPANEARATGPLVIVGGGGTPTSVIERTVKLGGGVNCSVAVLPQASRRENAGEKTVEMFLAAGAQRARVVSLSPDSLAADRAFLAEASVIWFPGGSQNRLMTRLIETKVAQLVRARHAAGAVVGGTSAGAAVMSKRMIKGDAVLRGVRRAGTPLGAGLELWPGTIVDQHFHRRQRFNRLLSAVLDHPTDLGVGIDERTAVIVKTGEIEVMGESSVLILDARAAKVDRSDPSTLSNAEGVRLHLLRAGSKLAWPPRAANAESPPR